MSYALVEDIAASWERYDVVARSLEPVPPGLLVHLAGPTDEGFRIIEIWESEAAWRDYVGDGEALEAQVDPAVSVRPIRREVRAVHVVVGDGWPMQVDDLLHE